ncbi:hypothetical protein [Aeoliella mucimassa]|nr:hypothetical protein [Aeoliella mucimassa]
MTTLVSTVVLFSIFAAAFGLIATTAIPAWHLTIPIFFILCTLCFAYGVIRVTMNHPLFDNDYFQWLSNTPWTPKHPLPKGSPLPVPTDAMVVAILSLLGAILVPTFEHPSWLPLLVPFVAYCGGLATTCSLANWLTDEQTWVYLTLVSVFLLLVLPVPAVALLIVPVLAASIACWGTWQSLQRFPWGKNPGNQATKLQESNDHVMIGWPYHTLMLNPSIEIVTNCRRALLESGIMATLAWATIARIPTEDLRDDTIGISTTLTIASIFATLGWIASYSPGLCDHLCFGYRWANRRWLLWRHDSILLVPLLVLTVTLLLPWLLIIEIGVPRDLGFAVTTGIAWFLFRGVGTSARELQLTGLHSKFGNLVGRQDFMSVEGDQSPSAHRTRRRS